MAKAFGTRALRQLLPISVLGLGASVVLFLIVQFLEHRSFEARFRQLADQRIVAVRANVDIALNTVDMVVGHYSVTPPLATHMRGFRRLVETTLAKHGFIQALSWDPKVTPETLAFYNRLGEREGRAGFFIFERDAEGRPMAVAPRPEYFPVYYIEPLRGNEKAAGFDLASHPVRRSALEAGRDSGRPNVTGRITLVQEAGEQFGVLVLAPVFEGGPSDDVGRNRANLTGYVSGVFRLGDLVASSETLTDKGSSMVEMHLFDLSAPPESSLLAPRSSNRTIAELRQGPHVAEHFQVAGRTWLLLASPGTAFVDGNRPVAAWVMLAVALLATLFYLSYLKAGIDRAEAAERFAHDMEQARRRLANAQRIAQLGHLEFQPEAGLVTVGEGAAAMLGLAEGSSQGSVAEIFRGLDGEARERLGYAFSKLEHEPLDLEFQLGERVIHARGRLPASGASVLISLQDITARKAAEKERANLISHMAEAGRMEALGTLAGGIAHEINTPTQYVGDNLAFLQEGIHTLLDVAGEARRAVHGQGAWDQVAAKLEACDLDFLAAELPAAASQAQDGTARIAHIVQAIKEFSYPSSKTPQRFDLNHMIEVAATVTRNQWKYTAEMEMDLDPELPKLCAIEGEINQVLVNLIVNAAQAIGQKAEGGAEPVKGLIRIITRRRGDGIILSVGDNGVGIPPENLRRIFELFFTTKPPGQGTGQGLAITHSIIHRHGGRIDVESRPGEGATFVVSLPIEANPSTGTGV